MRATSRRCQCCRTRTRRAAQTIDVSCFAARPAFIERTEGFREASRRIRIRGAHAPLSQDHLATIEGFGVPGSGRTFHARRRIRARKVSSENHAVPLRPKVLLQMIGLVARLIVDRDEFDVGNAEVTIAFGDLYSRIRWSRNVFQARSTEPCGPGMIVTVASDEVRLNDFRV